ncbi:hypothetical protein CDAR_108851 [Caerostris darwini]|uniref:Uncharacterized protein n=1 Tax=Caerostris darwini TaxID=1538125 RepID=A0AAV4RC06_9ARAC|nr:hypothetical protein CDAR_108851 [Caerostris darwini]
MDKWLKIGIQRPENGKNDYTHENDVPTSNELRKPAVDGCWAKRFYRTSCLYGVSPNVSDQVVRAAEGPRAHSALEGLLSSVPLQMAKQIAVAEEPTDTIIDGAGVKSLAGPFFFFAGWNASDACLAQNWTLQDCW